ncbi:MAG: diphthine synthase, partial [Saccharolobus sp.]
MSTLNLVGLGISKKFITRSAIDALANSDIIFFDKYTSRSCDISFNLLKEMFKDKTVIDADRNLLENNSSIIIDYLDKNYN